MIPYRITVPGGWQYSDDLIYLGHVDTGMEKIAGMENDFQAALETLE